MLGSNIGKYEAVKDFLAAENNITALQKLSAISDQNLIEQNKKYIATLIAVDYNPAMDADSDTVMVLMNKAYQHPFYGGESVYWARAILHLDVEDELPLMRRAHHEQLLNTNDRIINDKLFPNPTNSFVTFTSLSEFGSDESIEIFNSLLQSVAKYKLPKMGNNLKFDTVYLQQGIYLVKHLTPNGIVSENKLVIIK